MRARESEGETGSLQPKPTGALRHLSRHWWSHNLGSAACQCYHLLRLFGWVQRFSFSCHVLSHAHWDLAFFGICFFFFLLLESMLALATTMPLPAINDIRARLTLSSITAPSFERSGALHVMPTVISSHSNMRWQVMEWQFQQGKSFHCTRLRGFLVPRHHFLPFPVFIPNGPTKERDIFIKQIFYSWFSLGHKGQKKLWTLSVPLPPFEGLLRGSYVWAERWWRPNISVNLSSVDWGT